MKIGLIILFVVAVIVLAPLALIWAVNTLFATGIGYTISTWAAALILGGVVGGSKSSK
jgi:hypothetical protein